MASTWTTQKRPLLYNSRMDLVFYLFYESEAVLHVTVLLGQVSTVTHGCLPIDIRQNRDRISVHVLDGLNFYCYGVVKINARVHVYVRVSIHRHDKTKKKKRSTEKHKDEVKRAIEAIEKNMYEHEQG